MWFRRRKKPLIKGFLVLCLLLFAACQMYAILFRHEPSIGEPRLASRSPVLDRVQPPQRPGQDGSVDVNKSVQKGKDSKGVEKFGRREGRLVEETFAGERGQAEGFRSPKIINESLSLMKHRRLQTELKDVFISVKTSGQFHKTRVELLLKTWYGLARNQTYFFTDVNDAELMSRTDGHTVNTNCSSVHSREGLCCKMSMEFDYFFQLPAKYRWFCHVDDDTYINIPALLRLLQKYDHVDDWYIGKPSLNHPLEVPDPDSHGARVSFWFATGGAGFCISHGLALKMVPYVINGRLGETCSRIRLPDDCTIAFILYRYLSSELTPVREFHSHLEPLRRVTSESLAQQITLSYSLTTGGFNILKVPGFDEKEDPTRFLSIHCFLFPSSTGCPPRLEIAA